MVGQETVSAPRKSSIYAEPRTVTDLEDCYFYHSMEIPGHGLVEGPWDLRGGVDDYLGGVDLRDKRVLEIGTASGFLCFTMQGRGAEVVALERALRLTTETVIVTENPSLRYSLPQMAASLLKPAISFLPDFRRVQPRESWWHLTPAVIKQMIGVLGFEDATVRYHVQRFAGKRKPLFTVVGRRTVPLPQ